MAQWETIEVEITGQTGRLKLNRPDHGNGITLQLAKELAAVTTDWEKDEAIQLVILEANGKHFSVGGDLASFAEHGNKAGEHLKEVIGYFHEAIMNLVKMKKPVIAEVKGTVAGGGLGFVCAADIVYATESSRFLMAYTKAGLTPDGGSSFFLPKLVGKKKAAELTLLNRMLTGQEAEALGLITKAVPEVNWEEEIQALEKAFTKGAYLAAGKAKSLLNRGDITELQKHLEAEKLTLCEQIGQPEGMEGIEAFLEKRKPSFPRFHN
jgi:2-(1,2-epoxy-1,2-dihydrophenyl)acetyl-CoA isomerase